MSEKKEAKRSNPIWSLLARLPKPLWALFFCILVLALLYGLNPPLFGFYLRQPDSQAVFWQTMEKNLQSQQISLKSQVSLSLEQKSIEVLENSLQLDLGQQVRGSWSQKTLAFDQVINRHYPNPDQVDNYKQLGVSQLPVQDWYHQAVLALDEEMYMRHFFQARPSIADWQSIVDDPLAQLPQSERWYRVPLETDSLRENVYNFLIGLPASDALFYGDLPQKERQAFLRQLRRAYRVDWRNFESFYQDKDLYYKYQLKLDHENFSKALIEFYNLQIEKEADKLDSDQSIFLHQEVNYEIIIDVKRRQVSKVRHGVVVPLTKYDNYLSLRHQYSPLIYYLDRIDERLVMRVETNVVSQNQVLEFSKPKSLPLPLNKETEVVDD